MLRLRAIALDDAAELAHAYLRLGELYEERHDVTAAVMWYDRFTTLWATTDVPALQARVREVSAAARPGCGSK